MSPHQSTTRHTTLAQRYSQACAQSSQRKGMCGTVLFLDEALRIERLDADRFAIERHGSEFVLRIHELQSLRRNHFRKV